MPTLPWTPARSTAPPADALVLGSRLELRHYRSIPGFMRAAMKVRKQVLHSKGALGVSLLAQPLHKTFWTLSAWTDQGSLDEFVATLPHRDVMGRFHARLIDPKFVSWMVPGAALPKPHSNAKELWREAKTRLAANQKEGAR